MDMASTLHTVYTPCVYAECAVLPGGCRRPGGSRLSRFCHRGGGTPGRRRGGRDPGCPRGVAGPLSPAPVPAPADPAPRPGADGPGAGSAGPRPAAGPPPPAPAAGGTRSGRWPNGTRRSPTAPAPRTPADPAAAAPACAAAARAAGTLPRGSPTGWSLVERPGVEDRLRRPVAAQHHHQVGHHGRLALRVELDDVLLGDPGQRRLDHAHGTLDDQLPGCDDRARLLALEHRRGDLGGVGEVGEAG